MSGKKLEVVKGSGNVFRDLGQKHPDLDQFKAILATEIIKTLDREKLSVRAAQGRTGIRLQTSLASVMQTLGDSLSIVWC